MVLHKLRWLLYTAFLIWTGTNHGFRVPVLDPFLTNLTGHFVLPLFTSIFFLLPDIIQFMFHLPEA